MTYSLLFCFLGEGKTGSLLGASLVAEELRVNAQETGVSLSLGLVNAVPVSLLGLVMGRMILRFCHPFSIYYADYINQ